MKIVVTGAQGMLGRTLMRRLAGRYDLMGTSREQLDLTQSMDVNDFIAHVRPQVIIHCAAMTAVDLCEKNPEQAFLSNEIVSQNVACAADRYGCHVIAMSTDYVFKGDLNRPYHEQDHPDPQTVYGKSKLAAEIAITRYCSNHTIVRTAWLYGQGGPSFLHTISRLGIEEGAPLKVVNDQIGNPTSADVVADFIQCLLERPIQGIVHATCEGEATWYQFACEIARLKSLKRFIEPCTTSEYPLPALRPANSRLEKGVIRTVGFPTMPLWQNALENFLHEYPQM